MCVHIHHVYVYDYFCVYTYIVCVCVCARARHGLLSIHISNNFPQIFMYTQNTFEFGFQI